MKSRILITGGTGSFGGEVTRRLLDRGDVSEIVIFSRDEKKQHDMRQWFNSPKLKYIIGDVRDRDAVIEAMRGIDIVFHAAALKQVPTGEFFPMELVKTNILGTENVFRAAEESGVKKVVLLSTDKAVYPINAMGMSKAMAEKLMVARARNSKTTVFCAVRYGNVMASRGSVIPLFIDQIKNNKNITITNPKMTRFLLSLDHAIDLVEFAIKNGRSGDIFVKKAPAATVENLAKALIEIFDAKNKTEVIGVRGGEKIHETLANSVELMTAEDMGDYFRINSEPVNSYEKFYEKGIPAEIKDDYTSENTQQLSVTAVKELLLSLDYIKKELKQ